MLRGAKLEDLKEIKQLIDCGAKKNKILPRSAKELKEVIDCFYIWEDKGKVVGCCSLEIYSKRLAEIRSLIVEPSYERKGIGRHLTSACIKEAQKNNIYEILVISDKRIFFEKQGFRTCLNNQYALFIRPKTK